jgi:hypothetical protein
VQTACEEFLPILKQAEDALGTSLPIEEIGRRISRLPPGISVADLFQACKDQGWVMGYGRWTSCQEGHANDVPAAAGVLRGD